MLKERFIKHGFLVCPKALIPSSASAFYAALRSGVERRSSLQFLPSDASIEDATQLAFNSKARDARTAARTKEARLWAVRDVRRRIRRSLPQRRQTKRSDLSGEELEEIARRTVAAQSLLGPSSPNIRHAAEVHRANLWMTSNEVHDRFKADICPVLGTMLRKEIGMKRPVLFGDQPIVRDAYDSPMGFHFNAKHIGVDCLRSAAVGFYVFSTDHTPLRMPMRVQEGSHTIAAREVGGSSALLSQWPIVSMEDERSVEGDWRKFVFTELKQTTLICREAGTIVLVDPFLFVAFGANLAREPTVVYRGFVVEEDAAPHFAPPSWIRSLASEELRFGCSALFPVI